MITIYHDWLKDNPDVIGKTPALKRDMWLGVTLELYTGRKGDDPQGWCTAIISIHNDYYNYRFKYDGGSTDNDLEGMADDCEGYIKTMHNAWDWIHDAEREYKKQVPFHRRLFNRLKGGELQNG